VIMTSHAIPNRFVWTKMQAAAGESVKHILRRKELERQAGNGLFWWGIGESKGQAVNGLLEVQTNPEVLFSFMLSAPAKYDTDPGDVAVWQAYRTADGRERPVPPTVIVSSGAHTRSGNLKHRYYALICLARSPLHVTGGGALNSGELSNIGGRPVGSSQTTAVVERRVGLGDTAAYGVNARAELSSPFFANLVRPQVLSAAQRRLLVELGKEGVTVEEWMKTVPKIRASSG
jgi:hypothetical protein